MVVVAAREFRSVELANWLEENNVYFALSVLGEESLSLAQAFSLQVTPSGHTVYHKQLPPLKSPSLKMTFA